MFGFMQKLRSGLRRRLPSCTTKSAATAFLRGHIVLSCISSICLRLNSVLTCKPFFAFFCLSRSPILISMGLVTFAPDSHEIKTSYHSAATAYVKDISRPKFSRYKADLARFGKKQQLKVRILTFFFFHPYFQLYTSLSSAALCEKPILIES